MKLFVPGRICLFGEHTDWAGGYRRMNADLEKGYTIIAGTNQGVHADVTTHPTKLVITSTLPDGNRVGPHEIPMEKSALLAEAEKGGFFSYAAGVAYQAMTHYRVHGLTIDNYRTDLPVKKGLSSSAAVCVLVARAFNRLYDLRLTVRGEMDLAYRGEITTPSRCGRMDQGCAYGNRPILMTFDGDAIDVTELNVPHNLYFVIVDLHAGKDTKEILSKLNSCYPFALNDIARGVQEYLGPISKEITQGACEALKKGDAAQVGALMRQAQAAFDRNVQPACPSQLTAPVLHRVLSHPTLQPLILGGKGVGSQGDGTAQFIVRDEASQDKVVEIIERDLHMSCLKLVVSTGQRVRKAIIPAAGFGTRLFPASKAVKKELFPIVDRQGRAKPVMLAIVEEAINAGIEEVGIIVQPEDRPVFEEFFFSPPRIENFNKLSQQDREYSQYLQDIGHRITFINQETQEGFGHAVYCAKEWVNNEPFLLMLGDHLYASDTDVSCARQLLDVFERTGTSAVGVKAMPGAEIHRFGCVTGTWTEPDSLLYVTEFAEKPDLEYAREHLQVPGMEADVFLTVFGLYVLKPKVFDFLEENVKHNLRERGEFQLTCCLDRLRQEDGVNGYVVQGRRFDIGQPDAYRQALAEFRHT
jgi:UTP-glucose-1-phosphate uridylyltransferase/mevalonate kinase